MHGGVGGAEPRGSPLSRSMTHGRPAAKKDGAAPTGPLGRSEATVGAMAPTDPSVVDCRPQVRVNGGVRATLPVAA
jgi:hypothetical protein